MLNASMSVLNSDSSVTTFICAFSGEVFDTRHVRPCSIQGHVGSLADLKEKHKMFFRMVICVARRVKIRGEEEDLLI